MLNKLGNFSNDPYPELLLCDTYDWYAPTYQHHHTARELEGWFEAAGVTDGARPWLEAIRWPMVLLLASMSLGWIYRMVLGPSARTRARLVAVGIGGVIWIGGTFGMSVAAGSADQLQATFGSLGAVAVLLIWLYLSASAMLLAAEAESVLAHAWGRAPVRRSGRGRQHEKDHPARGTGAPTQASGSVGSGRVGEDAGDDGPQDDP